MPAISRAPLRSQPSAYLLLAAALLVSGCSSLPSKTQPGGIEHGATQTDAGLNQRHLASIEHIQDFNIEGRIGVQTDGRGVSGTIHWKHVDNKDDIALFSPMGGKMADVKSTEGNVTLTANDGKTYTAADAETLTQQTLGWRLPVSNLADWVVGRPTNDAIEQITWDDTGKLTKLTQDGWRYSTWNTARRQCATAEQAGFAQSQAVHEIHRGTMGYVERPADRHPTRRSPACPGPIMQGFQSFLAPAKVNLFLHITGRRADGYHLLQSAFRLLDFYDIVHIKVRKDGAISRAKAITGVPEQSDLCIRAALLLKQHTGCVLGADIAADKRIPMGGGLGGGSSDAATVLLALNILWGLNLGRQELMDLGLKLGADVPFFIFGENAWVEGIGEQIQPIALKPAHYVVLTPRIHVSTAEVFSAEELTRNTIPTTIAAFSGVLPETICSRTTLNP